MVSSMMEYHAAWCSCDEEGHYVLGCQGRKKFVLFVQFDAVPDTLPNQQEPAPQEDVEASGVNSQFHVGAYLVANFKGMYFVSEVVRQETGGAVRVKYLRAVRGKLNRYNWPAIEDVDDTPVEEIFLPRIPALQLEDATTSSSPCRKVSVRRSSLPTTSFSSARL